MKDRKGKEILRNTSLVISIIAIALISLNESRGKHAYMPFFYHDQISWRLGVKEDGFNMNRTFAEDTDHGGVPTKKWIKFSAIYRTLGGDEFNAWGYEYLTPTFYSPNSRIV